MEACYGLLSNIGFNRRCMWTDSTCEVSAHPAGSTHGLSFLQRQVSEEMCRTFKRWTLAGIGHYVRRSAGRREEHPRERDRPVGARQSGEPALAERQYATRRSSACSTALINQTRPHLNDVLLSSDPFDAAADAGILRCAHPRTHRSQDSSARICLERPHLAWFNYPLPVHTLLRSHREHFCRLPIRSCSSVGSMECV